MYTLYHQDGTRSTAALLVLEEGAPGDIIRLRNTKSFKVIRGRVIDSRIVQLGL